MYLELFLTWILFTTQYIKEAFILLLSCKFHLFAMTNLYLIRTLSLFWPFYYRSSIPFHAHLCFKVVQFSFFSWLNSGFLLFYAFLTCVGIIISGLHTWQRCNNNALKEAQLISGVYFYFNNTPNEAVRSRLDVCFSFHCYFSNRLYSWPCPMVSAKCKGPAEFIL